MPEIRVLDAHVADLIAAGEVVERPASVVKELAENAIDAGAKAVTIEIQRGGMALIRVTDDGCGIPEGECLTAFQRHATSKLRSARDLEAIGTLGFRGEALAAISAVARVELITCPRGQLLGTALTLEGGNLVSQEEAGCPAGTTLVVRDLFFNTPARLKFMRRDASEGAAVFAVVQRLALSHPEIAFQFIRDGRKDLATPGDGELRSALYAVFGRDLALGFLPVESQGEGVRVSGFASMPACCRGTRGYQHFFVNGRQVKSKTLAAAVERAYENQKMVGKFPGCVLQIDLRPSEVDVNVHPAKTEVKFLYERKVFDGVYYAVLSALGEQRVHPLMEVRPLKPAPAASETLPLHSAPAAPEKLPLHNAPAAPEKLPLNSTPEASERRSADAPSPRGPAASGKPGGDTFAPPPLLRPISKAELLRSEAPPVPSPEEPAPPESSEAPFSLEGLEPPPEQPEPSAPPEGWEIPQPPEEPVLPGFPEPPPQPQDTPKPLVPQEPAWRLAGEVLDTYLIVEQGDEIHFIDKHAAHERLHFDRLQAQDQTPMGQILLEPVVLNLPPRETEVLLENQTLLERYGFACECFGVTALIVRELPDYLEPGQAEETLGEIARILLSGAAADPARARDELLHTIACKAAVKGGQHSSPEELMVVAEAVMSGRVKYCPHGRPVAITMHRRELERQFKRA